MHLLRGVLGRDECAALWRQVARAAAHDGWQTARHAHFATTDFALWRAPEAAAWARARVASRVLPALSTLYGIPLERLALRESFVVRYEASGQPALALHKDSTLLSCNVLLCEPVGFDGGGTCFAEPVGAAEWRWHEGELRRTGTLAEATVLNGAQGDCVLHCGQQMHGAQPVTRGMRVVLVCFIDELYSQ